MTIPLLIILIAFAIVVGFILGAYFMAREYNANADKVFGICRLGKPVKVIHLDFYTSNMVDFYARWRDIMKKARPLKPGELTKGSAQGRMADVQSDNRPEMRRGDALRGVSQRPDVHPMGGGEFHVQGPPEARGGDVQKGV